MKLRKYKYGMYVVTTNVKSKLLLYIFVFPLFQPEILLKSN